MVDSLVQIFESLDQDVSSVNWLRTSSLLILAPFSNVLLRQQDILKLSSSY